MACRFLQCFAIVWLSSQIISDTAESNVCTPSIKVARNTTWTVSETTSLKINCTVEHCWMTALVPNVSWCLVNNMGVCGPMKPSKYTRIHWHKDTENKHLLFLIFDKISKQDSGLYRCELQSPVRLVSHSISVTVTDYVPEIRPNNTVISEGINTMNSTNGGENTWLDYNIYIYSGIGLLPLVVIVLCVTTIWCRGQKKVLSDKIHENQSMASPVADLPPPTYRARESPCIKAQTLPSQPPPVYDIPPPVRVRSLRDHASAGRHPVNHGPPRHRGDQGIVVEEETRLIYASLNHNAMPQRPQRIAHLQIEESEYAAVKVT